MRISVNWHRLTPELRQLIASIAIVGLIGVLFPFLHATVDEFLWVALLCVGVFAVKAAIYFVVAGAKVFAVPSVPVSSSAESAHLHSQPPRLDRPRP